MASVAAPALAFLTLYIFRSLVASDAVSGEPDLRARDRDVSQERGALRGGRRRGGGGSRCGVRRFHCEEASARSVTVKKRVPAP